MGLIIGLFGMLIAGSVFFFLMPFVIRILSHFFRTPQITFKQGLKLSFGFLALGPLAIAVVQLVFYVMGGSFPSSSNSTDSFESVLFIVITITTYFFGMVLFVQQELNESFHRAIRIAPIFLVAMGLVFIVLFYAFSFLIAKTWLG